MRKRRKIRMADKAGKDLEHEVGLDMTSLSRKRPLGTSQLE